MKPVTFFRRLFPVNVFPLFCFFIVFAIISNSISEASGESVASAKKTDPVILQLKWFHQFQFAGYYAALHKGFFQEEGLDVTIKAGGPKVIVDKEVSSGKANFGVLASELIQKKAQGQPLVLLAVVMQHSIRAIIVRADSGINAPSGLIDRQMMLNRNEDTEFMAMFIAEGIALNRLKITQKDKSANTKFINGEIDALNGSIGNQPFIFQNKGIPVKTIRPISYGIDFYGDSLFTSEAELKKHPDRVAAFRRASLRGWEYAMEYPSEIIDLIIAEYNSKKNRAQLQFEADAMRELILPGLVDIGHVNPHRVDRIAQAYAERNIVPPNYSLEGFIYDPTPASNAKLIRRLIIGFFVFVVAAMLCGLVLIVFNKRLKKLVAQRTKELSQSNNSLLNEIGVRKEAEKSLQSIVESTVGVTGQNLYDKIVTSLCELFNCDVAILSEIVEPSKAKSLSMVVDGKIIRDYSYELSGTPCENAEQKKICVYPEHIIDLFPEDKYLKGMQAVGYVGTPLTNKDGKSIGILCAVSRSRLDLPKHSEELIKIMATRASAEIQSKQSEEMKIAAEMKLRQVHKMEAIGTLAGGIAHDFNNILAAVLGYADMAMDDTPDHSPAKYKIEQVLKAGNRAKDLVKHILSFSRKESQERVSVQIHEIVTDALKLIRGSIPTTIEIKKNIDSKCGNILAESTQIHQVLMNLCTNAAQSMDENGGVLEVCLSSAKLSADDLENEPNLTPGHYIQLSVKDSGTGIDQKYLDRIFDPYFTTKEVGKGSGMGLAVVSGIVKSHDGMITVNSNPGEGATFNVFFPRIEEQIQEEIADTAPLPTGKEKVLIVDDEESMVDMTKRRVERLGYQVTANTSSMAALELFRSQPDAFDLVITDQTMPELTGEKLAKKLMEIRPDIPIIICTGYSSKMDAEKANIAGISAFIMKPVDKKELAKTIRQVLDRDTSKG